MRRMEMRRMEMRRMEMRWTEMRWIDVELWSDADMVGRLALEPVVDSVADIQVITPVDYSDRVRFVTRSSVGEQLVSVLASGVEPGTDIEAQAAISSKATPPAMSEEAPRSMPRCSACRLRTRTR